MFRKGLPLATFGDISNNVWNRGKSVIPPFSNGSDVFTSASENAKLFAKHFYKNSNLDDSGHEVPTVNRRTEISLSNTVIIRKMVKKAISNHDSSKASGPDGIPVVVLKICEPKLSFILTDLFNLCLKELCFPDCWKVLSAVAVFKNVGERSDL